MDLERIKQNLRLRSGSTKKSPKKPKSSGQTVIDQNNRNEPPRSSATQELNGQFATPPPANADRSTQQSLQPNSDTLNQNATILSQEPDLVNSPSSPDPGQRPNSYHTVNEGDLDLDTEQKQEKILNLTRTKEPQGLPQESYKPKDEPVSVADSSVADESQGSERGDFDLRPPAPRPRLPSLEHTSELLFSAGHLNTLLYNPTLVARFTAFLRKYRPQDYPLLTRYLETSKAIKAIEYANAVAESAPALPQPVEGNKTETSNIAARLDPSFAEACSSAFDTFLNTSLPLYITYSLVRTISECLIDEITGRSTPFMQDMVGGLSEVFCLTDPNQEDNPIIYSSEEFYRLTGYGQDSVLGHNCRFLQGPKTNRKSIQRIRDCLHRGEETYEALLNYRKDGKPFINLLMIAPLHDDKGNVKYNLGAQVDVSHLIESGRILDGFQKYLIKREVDTKWEAKEKARGIIAEDHKKQAALRTLRELSELFDLEESAVIQSHSRASSMERDEDTNSMGSRNVRRRFIDPDISDDDYEHESAADREDWNLGQSGPSGLSGKLPGVYEKYMLIRPSPSLRIVFASPKLRKFGNFLQSPFLSHVAAPVSILSGLAESFESGTPVSAKINFMPERAKHRFGTRISSDQRHEDGQYGRACWMSATPLLGSDDRVGVWMIVFVEKMQARMRRVVRPQTQDLSPKTQKAEKSSPLRRADLSMERTILVPPSTNQSGKVNEKRYNIPIKPKRLDDAIYSTPQPNSAQRADTAYKYQVTTPVEEYQSAEEDGNFSEAITQTPVAHMTPQTPKYGIEAEEFVRLTVQSPSSSPHRLILAPDSDEEQDDELNIETGAVNVREQSFNPASNRQAKNEPEIPNNILHSFSSDRVSLPEEDEGSTDNQTLSQAMSPSTDEEHTVYSAETIRQHESSSSQQSRKDSSPEIETIDSQLTPAKSNSHGGKVTRQSGTLPASLGYMDYLRHPGTSRQVSNEVRRGRRRNRHGEDSDEPNETECANSPYSVD